MCYNTASVLCFGFFWLRGMWDLSSPTRDWTRTPCIGRQSLNHWTAREALKWISLCFNFFCFIGLVFFSGNHYRMYSGSTLPIFSFTSFQIFSFFLNKIFFLIFLWRHYLFCLFALVFHVVFYFWNDLQFLKNYFLSSFIWFVSVSNSNLCCSFIFSKILKISFSIFWESGHCLICLVGMSFWHAFIVCRVILLLILRYSGVHIFYVAVYIWDFG